MGIKNRIKTVQNWLIQPVSILPLVGFRILFGMLMLLSTIRFVAKGWVEELYLTPEFHFPYWGFAWVKPLPGIGLYVVFALLGVAALLIGLGLFYRLSALCFFLLFTYVELLDKSYYLNHYYFVSLASFLLIWLPGERYFSLDVHRGLPSFSRVPRWTIGSLQFQLGIVYFFAGLAKLNPDWLFFAQPLKIWLSARAGFPLVGLLFDSDSFAFLMSWAGVAFDLTIPFFLVSRRTRVWAYLAVLGFHSFTGWLFPIGVFPWLMIGSTVIFFDEADYRAVFAKISRTGIFLVNNRLSCPPHAIRGLPSIFILFFILQLFLPLRHFLSPGDVLWNEEGARFSWRVMIAEKTGTATFFITHPVTGKTQTIYPGDYLTPQQEKQMAFQPDMILDFAHYLRDEIISDELPPHKIRVEVFVSLNGRPAQLLIDPSVDLAKVSPGFNHQDWVMDFKTFDPMVSK